MFFAQVFSYPDSRESEVKGFHGESVILPCSFSGNNLNSYSVHWRDDNGTLVCDIINGNVTVGPEYKDRVETFLEEYELGNASVKLKNLRKTDARKYTCFIKVKTTQHSDTTKLTVIGEYLETTHFLWFII